MWSPGGLGSCADGLERGPVTDQAVDSGCPDGAEAAGPSAAQATPDPRFFGRQRELKALRADIERAGLDTLAGRKAPAPAYC